MLERYAMKVARTVLRGGSGSNATPLPDQGFALAAQARNIGKIHTFGALNPQVRADWIVSRSG
jgi:hypothetical protein